MEQILGYDVRFPRAFNGELVHIYAVVRGDHPLSITEKPLCRRTKSYPVAEPLERIQFYTLEDAYDQLRTLHKCKRCESKAKKQLLSKEKK